MAGHKVGPEFAVYAASEFAGRVLAEGLLQEVKPYNIRTTVISAGVRVFFSRHLSLQEN